MASPKVKFKRSSVAGKIPALSNLETGELALNTYDGKLFLKVDTGGIGIGTTVSAVNPWNENYGASGISYGGNINVTGVSTFADVNIVGTCTATAFVGDGSGLTNIVSTASTSNVVSDTIQVGVITATSQFYPPALSTTERDALIVTQGAMIFNTTESKVQMYLGSEWKSLAFELDTYTSIGI